MPSFNLLTEPWIRVRENGSLSRVGIHDAVVRAHEFTALEHSLPIVEFGIYRLLVAVLLDAIQPRNVDALVEILKAGRFDEEMLGTYFETWSERFDLFSEKRPFLQDGTAPLGKESIARLLPSQPSGTNARHWQHLEETAVAVSPGEAAGLLAAIAPFMTAGGAGLAPSINGAPPWYVWPTRMTLLETLTINLPAAELPSERGIPAWRRETPLITGERRRSATLLEALTWQPRRVRLVIDAGGICSLNGEESSALVRRIFLAAGESCDFHWQDPHVAYRVTSEKTVPARPREARAPWRDIGTLVLTRKNETGSTHMVRPSILLQLDSLSRETGRDEIGLIVYGMRTDMKMKTFEWFRQNIDLPGPLIPSHPFHQQLIEALAVTEGVQDDLRKSIITALARADKPPAGRTASSQTEAMELYWGELESIFGRCARDLLAGASGATRDVQEILYEYRRNVAKTAHRAFEKATEGLRADASRLMAVERGRRRLAYSLARTLSPQPGADTPRPSVSKQRIKNV